MSKIKPVRKNFETVARRHGHCSAERGKKVVPFRGRGLSAAELRRIVIEMVG